MDCPLGYAHEEPEKAREQVTASPGLPAPRPGPLLHQSPSHAPAGQAGAERLLLSAMLPSHLYLSTTNPYQGHLT